MIAFSFIVISIPRQFTVVALIHAVIYPFHGTFNKVDRLDPTLNDCIRECLWLCMHIEQPKPITERNRPAEYANVVSSWRLSKVLEELRQDAATVRLQKRRTHPIFNIYFLIIYRNWLHSESQFLPIVFLRSRARHSSLMGFVESEILLSLLRPSDTGIHNKSIEIPPASQYSCGIHKIYISSLCNVWNIN